MIKPLEIAALVEKFAPPGTGKSTALRLAIRRGVTEQVLKPMDELPSTRKAAAALSMSRNSVIDAYEELQAEGVIETRRGARPRVCELPVLKPRPPLRQLPITLSARGRDLSGDHRAGYVIGDIDAFAPGLPDPNLFPRDDWAICLRRVARRDLRGHDHYDHFEGLPSLREALALHLKRARGVSISPEQVFVVPNTQSGMALLTDLVTDPGDKVLLEDPCYAGARALFAAKGLRIGALPDRFPAFEEAPQTKLIYVTPSTQFPTGIRMRLRRRLDLLAFAEAQNALVVEDDYDGDFAWKGADVPPVFSLDKASSVALIGTLSKSIMPGMRLAWLVVPPLLVESVRRAHRALGLSVNSHVQAALGDFIISGLFARHLRAAARAYSERMVTLTEALRAELGNHVDVSAPDGGLQVLLRFAPEVDDVAVKDLLWTRGYQVVALSRLCLEWNQRGILVGFARANGKNAARFASVLSDVLRGL
ncbi:MAG: PLP-dependent aminotransferase family protein [Pseudomonadota bacterium]